MNEEVEVLGKWLSERMWRKSGSLTPGELAVVKALLPPDDPRTPKLIRQAEEAPEVTRMRITPSSYEATIPFVRNSFNLVDLDADVTSPELELIISGSLKPVSFRIKLLRGGFLHQIEGESIDGSDWDIHWEPSSESLSEVAGTRVVENWIPVSISEEERLTVVRDIEDWLRVPRGHISKFSSDELSVRRGCGPEDLAVCERRAGLTLPRQYKELLRISDGLTLHRGRDYAINGTSDLYHVDLDLNQAYALR